MGTQGGTGRKRGSNKERSTAEDDALNLIAREAEARLAAKRAARAEAREIRMKELERQQKELSDDDERMSVGSRSSVRVEGDYLEKGSRAASVLTAGTLTSLGGSSSRRGSVDTAIDADAETSIREIKEIHELKDQIQDVETKYTQNLKEVKNALVEVDEKYRKAMVSNAQLDNEKNNLMYQVDNLKDSLMELEELLSESRREYEEKVKEHEREKQAHSTLQFQYNQLQDTLKQSEEMLNKHGIVLGPDLNINGDVEETDGQTQDSQRSPTEGNSVLGRGQEPQLGSSGAEKLDSQHPETFEEPKESLLSSTAPCSLAIVSGDTTSNEEQQINVSSVRDSVEEVTLLKKDSDEDIPITDVQNAADTVPGVGEVIASSDEKVTGIEVNGVESTEKGDLVDTSEPEAEAKTVSVDEMKFNEMINGSREMTKNDLSENQATTPEEVEMVELNTRSVDSSAPPGEISENTVNENIPDNSAPVIVITEPHVESESAEEEAGNEEPKELPAKPQPQSTAAAAGKKKKRKKKKSKKKKGGSQEEEKQSNGAEEKRMSEKIESVTHEGNATESSPLETPNEPEMVQLPNEQDRQEVNAESCTESSVSTTNLTGSISAGNHDAKPVSSIAISKDGAESPGETDALIVEPEISDMSKDESVFVNEVSSGPLTNNQVNRTDTTDSTANIEAELHHPSNTGVTGVQSEAVNNSECKKNDMELPSITDIFFDCVASLSGSKVPLDSDQTTTVMSDNKDQTDIQSSVESALDISEMVNKEDDPTLEMNTKSFSCNDGNDGDHSTLSQEETGKDPELNVGLMEPENSPPSDCTDSPTEIHLDESSEKSCNVSVDKPRGSDDKIMSEHVDHASGPAESQGFSMPVFVDEKEAKETDLDSDLGTEQGDSTDILQTSDLAKDAAKTGSLTELDHHSDEAPAIDEDGQSLNGYEESEDSGDKTSNEEQQINISSVRDSVEEVTLLNKDILEDIQITHVQNAADTVPEVGEVIASTVEKVTGVEVNEVESTEKGDLVDTSEPEVEAKTVTVDDLEPVVNEMIIGNGETTKNNLSEDQATTPEEVEIVELNTRSVDSSARPGEIIEDTMNENIPEAYEDSKPSPAHQQDPEEEHDEEGDEGLSFDFDDMDSDAAENVPSTNQVAEPETDLEVMPVEVNRANTELGQDDVIRSQEEALQVASQEEPAESDQEKPTIHATLDEDPDSVSQDHQLPSDIETVHAEKGGNEIEEERHTLEGKTIVTDEQAHGSDEAERGLDEPELGLDEPVHGSERGSGNAGQLGVVESNSVEGGKQEVLVEKEEGVKVSEQDLEVPHNTAEQASSKKESPPSGKDSKKNGKKGKSKGKEDCKMS